MVPTFNLSVHVDLRELVISVGYWGSTNWDDEDTNQENDLYIGYDWEVGVDGEYSLTVGLHLLQFFIYW